MEFYQFLRGIALLNLVVPWINGVTADDSSLCSCCHMNMIWSLFRLYFFTNLCDCEKLKPTHQTKQILITARISALNKQREMLFLHRNGPYFVINHEFATPINGYGPLSNQIPCNLWRQSIPLTLQFHKRLQIAFNPFSSLNWSLLPRALWAWMASGAINQVLSLKTDVYL